MSVVAGSMADRSGSAGIRAGSRTGTARVGMVRAWLVLLALMVLAMVAVGGATRLTGSGLSITEWKPVTGAVPPMSEGAWDAEFTKYRASSQYRNLNRGMELPEFKTIYWWEWSHRQLGRLIGIVFALPLAAFWFTGAIGTGLALRVLAVGALGGLQATVGWIMVASGLEAGMIAVAPIKLMLHLVLAATILAALAWIADGVGRARRGTSAASRVAGVWFAGIFLALVFVQIGLGGLVAGSRAGWTYNTWPLMDGRMVPPAETLFAVKPSIENLVDNPALVQLTHRLTAYAVVVLALWQAWRLRGAPGAGRAATIAGLSLAQMALGVATLVLVVPLWAGLAHQLLAMGLLVAATLHLRRTLTPA